MKFGVSMMMMGLTLGFGLKAHALCVMMQNFAPGNYTFGAYTEYGFFQPVLNEQGTRVPQTQAITVGGVETPVKTKVEVAGEPCYVFKTYEGLQNFITRKYSYSPVVQPHEPILIFNNTHGDPGGEVLAGDILGFVKEIGKDHPIALSSVSCYGSDLLAKMLLDQDANPNQAYINNFCLMTVSPFSHIQFIFSQDINDKKLEKTVDTTTATFISGMNKAQIGKSFAQYFQENNYYQDATTGEQRPLGICSAANWGEMGLVDYLRWEELFLNFIKPYQEGEYKLELPPMPMREELVAAAANLINNINTLLNADYCYRKNDGTVFGEYDYLYYAANSVCSSVQEIKNAQLVLDRYTKGSYADRYYQQYDDQYNDRWVGYVKETEDLQKNRQAFLAKIRPKADSFNALQDKWEHQCSENSDGELKSSLQELHNSDKERKLALLPKFWEVARRVKKECDVLWCDYTYAKWSKKILSSYDAEKLTSTAINNLEEEAQLEMQDWAYVILLEKRLRNAGIDLKPSDIIAEVGSDVPTCSFQNRLEVDVLLKSYTENLLSKLASPQFVQQCKDLKSELLSRPTHEWPKLRTDYESNNPYAYYLAQILLGVLDINELKGRGFNGISATSKDTDQAPYTPARDLLFVFHQVMNESMKRTPNKEKFPLDERRRKACENFKLGGLAAQK